jgi:hypothetical protein
MTEPDITINGVRLGEAHAATVRVAVMHMESWVSTPSNREGLGEVGDLYRDRLHELERMMGVRT